MFARTQAHSAPSYLLLMLALFWKSVSANHNRYVIDAAILEPKTHQCLAGIGRGFVFFEKRTDGLIVHHLVEAVATKQDSVAIL